MLTATIEVSNALIQVSKLNEQEIIAKQRTDTLSAAVRNSQLLFKNDMANYLEVITAQNAALADEVTEVSIQTRRMQASVLLVKAIGGGWSVSQIPRV